MEKALSIKEINKRLHEINKLKSQLAAEEAELISKKDCVEQYIGKWFVLQDKQQAFEYFKPLQYKKLIIEDWYDGATIEYNFSGLYIFCTEGNLQMENNHRIAIIKSEVDKEFSKEAEVDPLYIATEQFSHMQKEMREK
jgi:hypothetical protein